MSERNKFLLGFLVFLFSVNLLGSALSTDYYVKTGGDDAADGLSWDTAWQTIEHAQANAAVGDGQWCQDNDPGYIEMLKDEAINNYGGLKWFYLDNTPEGWGGWHGLFNIVHIAPGTYDETFDLIFNPPAWVRWEGPGINDTTLFTIGWYNNHMQISNDYVVITDCTIGSMYDPTFMVSNSDLAMIDVGIGGSWIGSPTNLLFEDCVLSSGASMVGALEFNYATDSRFINISSGLGFMNWVNINGVRNRFESVTVHDEGWFGLSGDNITVTGCSGKFELCGDSRIAIDNTTFSDTLYIKKHNYISNIGGLTDQPLHIAFDGTYMWLTERRNNKCYQYNQNTGDSLKSWNAPASEPRGIAWDGSHLWVVCTIGGTICYETDTDGNVLSQFNICGSALTWVDGYLYTYCSNSFYKYDTSGNVIDIYPITVPATALAYDGTYIWGLQSGTESIINKFSVTGELLESIDTKIYRYITAWFSGIAADTDNHIWIMQDDQGSTSLTFLIGDGMQNCTDCDLAKVTTEDGTTLSLVRNDKKFYEMSAGNVWTTVTSSQTLVEIPENTSEMTLTERPFLIGTTDTIDMLITTWETTGDYIKHFTASCTTPATTFTYTIGDMPADADVQVSTSTGWSKVHTTNGSGSFTGTYDGGWSEKEFTVELFAGDSTPPATTLTSVAGDSTLLFVDVVDDSETDIVVEGEEGMSCRFGDADVVYLSMSGVDECSVVGSTATCSLGNLDNRASYTRYVSCVDSFGNEQTTLQNLDVDFDVGCVPHVVDTVSFPEDEEDRPLIGGEPFVFIDSEWCVGDELAIQIGTLEYSEALDIIPIKVKIIEDMYSDSNVTITGNKVVIGGLESGEWYFVKVFVEGNVVKKVFKSVDSAPWEEISSWWVLDDEYAYIVADPNEFKLVFASPGLVRAEVPGMNLAGFALVVFFSTMLICMNRRSLINS